MSRQGQLPPRCPVQKKSASAPINDVIYPSSPINSYIGHYRSPSQNSILEDQPAWLDDLLGDTTDANSKGVALRRSASDSVVLMGELLDSLSSLNPMDDEEILGSETCGGIESACVYGPNSPRRKNNSSFSNNTIASAFSEYVSQKPHRYLDDTVMDASHSDLRKNASSSVCVSNAETMTAKRHPGQRSRVRKLQYIAELEKTVTMLQADLSVRVASLLQKRAALSLENSRLKQEMARLKQDKLAMEGEYLSLKKEAQRLKSGLASYPNNKARQVFGSNVAARAMGSGIDWKMLDMGKLNLD